MLKYYINVNTTNMIKNYVNDNSYFVTPNSFHLNSIKIGPFTSSKNLEIAVQDFLQTNFKGQLKDTQKIEKVAKNNIDLYYLVKVK